MPSFKDTCYQNYKSELGDARIGDDTNPYLLRLVRQYIPRERAIRICDLGCGAGTLLSILEKAGYQNIEGIDCSPSQVERRIHPAVQFGDALAYLGTKTDSSLDVVIAYDVIEHLNRVELLEWVREVNRVLSPDGQWVVHVPNAAGLFGNRVRYADLTHEAAFTFESLRQLGQIGGFNGLTVFEDKPTVHGTKSLLRRIVWDLARLPLLLFWTAETGSSNACFLSQNLLAIFSK